MSTNIKNLDPHRKREALLALENAARAIEGKDAVQQFVNQLLTESEQVTIGRRILMARLILQGKTKAEVKEELRVSPNTFSRTKQWLNKQIPNYGEVVKQYEIDQEKKRQKKLSRKKLPVDPFSFVSIKRRYPMHFLLFNLFDKD